MTVRAAAYALIAFFLAVLPANIYAVRAGVTLRGKPATNLLVRSQASGQEAEREAGAA